MVNTRSVRQHDTASPDLEQSVLSLVGAGGGRPVHVSAELGAALYGGGRG